MAVKSICCSLQRTWGLGSQHPHQVAHYFYYSSPGASYTLFWPMSTYHMWYTHRQNNLYTQNKSFLKITA